MSYVTTSPRPRRPAAVLSRGAHLRRPATALGLPLLCVGLWACERGGRGEPSAPRPLGAAEDGAVVRLVQGAVRCTGSLVAPRVVLTARHCVPSRGDPVQVSFGGAPPVSSVRAELAPMADLALLLLERPAPAGVVPLTLPTAPGAAPPKGASARLVGFGHGAGAASDEAPKHAAELVPVDDDASRLYLRAAPRGVCSGDSGGPVLLREGEGERLVAVAASTTRYERESGDGCAAVLTATRLDAHLPFLAAFLARAREGAAALGDGCYFEGHCAAGLTCDATAGPRGVRVCTRPCDDAHPCPAGLSCAQSRCAAPTATAASAPTAPTPATCARDEECQTGVCAALASAGKRCLPRCYPEAAAACPAGTGCVADGDAPTRYVCVPGAPGADLEAGEEGGCGGGKVLSVALLLFVVLSVVGRLGARRQG